MFNIVIEPRFQTNQVGEFLCDCFFDFLALKKDVEPLNKSIMIERRNKKFKVKLYRKIIQGQTIVAACDFDVSDMVRFYFADESMIYSVDFNHWVYKEKEEMEFVENA